MASWWTILRPDLSTELWSCTGSILILIIVKINFWKQTQYHDADCHGCFFNIGNHSLSCNVTEKFLAMCIIHLCEYTWKFKTMSPTTLNQRNQKLRFKEQLSTPLLSTVQRNQANTIRNSPMKKKTSKNWQLEWWEHRVWPYARTQNEWAINQEGINLVSYSSQSHSRHPTIPV